MINIEFYSLIRDIIKTEEFQKMKAYKHHIKSNTYKHSIKVAYLCFKFYKKHKHKSLTLEELVRGALLHDYYLYDWRDKKHKMHGFRHPKIAYENASNKYNLTNQESDMIKRHMFPLTLIPPKTKGGWLVCFYDKVAAISDYLGKNKSKRKFKLT